ncbi:MAG: protein kinase [Planctomycetales bacterium]|nr:protein kinase [Planctomycetales bacterium]
MTDEMLDALLAEYMRRIDEGLTDPEAFLREHPQHAAELRELLEVERHVLEMAGPELPDEESHPADLLRDDAETRPLPAVASDETTSLESPELFTEARSSAPSPAPPLRHSGAFDVREPVPFGNYELLEILGRGGMGVVYRARQLGLDREVAVKMIRNSQLASDEDVQRFYTEARAAANVRHEHVVDIYEIGEIDSQHFFSMELIEGSDLAQILREGRLESRRAAMLLRDAASAVQAAHEQGLLHRDLKPANILIEQGDRVVVTDFGLAHDIGTDERQRLTATGLAMGTPAYMSPEQAGGKRDLMGPASDIYSLGTVLFAMLTGEPPHRGQTVMDTLLAVMHQAPIDPARLNADADPALCRICLKCLEKDPADRYASAADLVADLTRYLNGEPVHAAGRNTLAHCLRWTCQIPLIAALRGCPAPHPTQGQLRAQAGMVLTLLASIVAIVAAPRIQQYAASRMPHTVGIAGGVAGGVYDQQATLLAGAIQAKGQCKTKVLNTAGALANRQALLTGDAQLALLQASALDGDELAVVAPLLNELIYVIVRRGRVERWEELSGARMAVGAEGSGMAGTAALVLRDSGATTVHEHFTALGTDKGRSLDGAVVTMGRGGKQLAALLSSGDWQLLPPPEQVLERLTADPWFRPAKITDEAGGEGPGDGTQRPVAGQSARLIATVSTPAFLACRRGAPAAMVRQALQCLYEDETASGVDAPDRISLAEAIHWNFMPLHPAAREYFQQRAQ